MSKSVSLNSGISLNLTALHITMSISLQTLGAGGSLPSNLQGFFQPTWSSLLVVFGSVYLLGYLKWTRWFEGYTDQETKCKHMDQIRQKRDKMREKTWGLSSFGFANTTDSTPTGALFLSLCFVFTILWIVYFRFDDKKTVHPQNVVNRSLVHLKQWTLFCLLRNRFFMKTALRSSSSSVCTTNIIFFMVLLY